MTISTISSGTHSGLTISNNTTLTVIDAGVIVAARVGNGGTAIESAGGSASKATLFAGGSDIVASGGHATLTTVSSGGLLAELGGVAVSARLLGGGSDTVGSGGIASATFVSSGAVMTEAAGGVASVTRISAGGRDIVLAGGTAGATTVSGAGTLIESGGIASATTLDAGGQDIVLSGGATSLTSVGGAGAVLTVSAGGVASSTTVHAGGTLTVSSGGAADGATLLSGGHAIIWSGGSISSTLVSGAGTLIESGGLAVATTLEAGGRDLVSRGGQVSATSVGSLGLLAVSAGGSASATTLLAGGSATVAAGGSVSDVTLSGAATLALATGAVAVGGIGFVGPSGLLSMQGNTGPAALIGGFALGDTIDLTSIASSATTATVSGTTVVVKHGATTLDLGFAAGSDLAGLTLKTDGHGGTDLLVCFWPGTLIRGRDGAVPVETLRRGDPVALAEGGFAPVRWLGRQTVALRFADPLLALPVCIRAGALAEGVPQRDLLLSPGHAILLDGALVQAGALVNGRSILRLPAATLPDSITYFHVELDRHALLLAEAVAAESFVDNVERFAFDNWAGHEALFADLPPIVELPWPRAKARRQVAEITRHRLAARAAGFAAATADAA